MIDIQFKIHDKFSVEFKVGFYLSPDNARNTFAVNMWLFVPNSLDITSQSYSKDQFYRDIKSNIRLITPIFLMRDIAGGTALPLKNLETSFRNLVTEPDRQNIADYEYQIKMFMAIFKSAARDEMFHILNTPLTEDISEMCDEYVDNVRRIVSSYRGLRRIINVPTVSPDILNYYLFGDEFMGNMVDKYGFRLIAGIKECFHDQYRQNIEKIKSLLREEVRYRESMGYPVAEEASPTANRQIVFRQGVLKKYIESDLFLQAKKKKDAVIVEQLYLSVAAGIAMIFATAVAFAFQQRYGNFTMPLFVALVVSYMLKDRIKDTMRYFFAHRLGSKYFDNKTTVSIKEERIGWVKEGMDFITDSKAPREVMLMRSRSPLLQAENRINDEKVILYRKIVELDGDKLREENRYAIAGINEIIRLHFNSFVKKMDNPEVPVNILDEHDRIETLMGDKVYYLNVVIQLQHEQQLDYKRIRLVFNRTGIIELEEFK